MMEQIYDHNSENHIQLWLLIWFFVFIKYMIFTIMVMSNKIGKCPFRAKKAALCLIFQIS